MKVGGSLEELSFFNLWDLQIDGIRIELNCGTSSWCWRIVGSGNLPHIPTWSEVSECSVWVDVQSLRHVWLWDLMGCCTPGFPVLHYLPEFAQTHAHWVDDAIQPSHPLSPTFSPSPPHPSRWIQHVLLPFYILFFQTIKFFHQACCLLFTYFLYI